MSFSVVIPSYNGKTLLNENLPPILAILKDRGKNEEILVVDDGSTDGSEDFLRREFPEVIVLPLDKNQGFAQACNAGFQAARGEIIILLNNDVLVVSKFLDRLNEHFRDDKVFAVAFCMIDRKTNTVISTPTVAKMRYGLIVAGSTPMDNTSGPSITFLAHGGGAAFRKNLFVELKGFDPLFSPFYYEDIDLSYRAWGSGFQVFYDPECVVWHSPMSTIGKKYNKKQIETIHRKNKILFFWKNISQPRLILVHLLSIPFTLICALFLGRLSIFKSYYLALKQFPQVIKRRKSRGVKIYNDCEILKMIRTGIKDTGYGS